MISRRSLFALFGGAAIAPAVKMLPVAVEPEIISQTWQWKQYSGFDIVSRNNALLDLMKRKMLITEQRMADDIATILYGDDSDVDDDDDTKARWQSLDDDYEDDWDEA